MSRSGEIVLPWGDADRTFRLTIPQWEKIQEKCDAGPGEIARRLSALPAVRARFPQATHADLVAMGAVGEWRVHDVREVLYRGLIGGGMEPTQAGNLVRELHDERPLLENVPLALAVVMASIVGAEDEEVGEGKGEPPMTSSPAANSASQPSTESPQPPASTSPTAPSGSSAPAPTAGGRSTVNPAIRRPPRPTNTTTSSADTGE